MDEGQEQPAPQPAAAPVNGDPVNPPGPGEEALHYAGEAPIERAGYVFAPDSLVIVPSDVAYRLAGHDHLRIVAETAESWANYLAMRARVRAG